MRKYFIIGSILSGMAFFGVYSLLTYLFNKNVDWKMSIITTIVYFVINIAMDILGKGKFHRNK